MGPKILTQGEFYETLNSEGIVLIDWWADGCEPCRAFDRVFDEVASGHQDLTFAKIDAEREFELAASLAIFTVPTLMIARDGILLFAHTGFLPEETVEDLITQAQALDMSEVLRKVAEVLAYGVS
jgi:thioredoxin 1